MADEQTAEAPVPEKASLFKRLLIPAAMAIVLAGLIMGGLYFTGVVSFGAADATVAGEGGEGGDAAEGETREVERASGPAFYAALRPPMVVQFDSGGKRHFLKVAIDVMSHRQPTIEAFKLHDAVIRNNLILMLQDLDFEVASTRAGIEKLQADAEREIEDVLEPYLGSRDVEGVYFTTFVLQ